MLQGHKNSVISVAPSPQGELFATGSGDLRARIWRYVFLGLVSLHYANLGLDTGPIQDSCACDGTISKAVVSHGVLFLLMGHIVVSRVFWISRSCLQQYAQCGPAIAARLSHNALGTILLWCSISTVSAIYTVIPCFLDGYKW